MSFWKFIICRPVMTWRAPVIVRDDDRTLKYNVLLQSKPNPGNDGKKPVMVCKFNKACNSIETQFICHASDNSELSKWTKNTVIINDF